MMMDPNADPFVLRRPCRGRLPLFGASDIQDLNWVQLLNVQRSCPANITGKKAFLVRFDIEIEWKR
jgi:hypothetical protein